MNRDELYDYFLANRALDSNDFAELTGLPKVPGDFQVEIFRKNSSADFLGELFNLNEHLSSIFYGQKATLGELTKSKWVFQENDPLFDDTVIKPYWDGMVTWINDYVEFLASQLKSDKAKLVFVYSCEVFVDSFDRCSYAKIKDLKLTEASRHYFQITSFRSFLEYCEVVVTRLNKISTYTLDHHVTYVTCTKPSLHYLWERIFSKAFRRFHGNNSGSVFSSMGGLSIEEMFEIVSLSRRADELGLGDFSYEILKTIIDAQGEYREELP